MERLLTGCTVERGDNWTIQCDCEHRLERRESKALQLCQSQTEFFRVLRRLCMVLKSPAENMCVATSTPHRQKIVKEVEVSWEAVSA
jgi:hypothetical protein